jgi:RimJ/RimL family protein N-acetyltransferase
MLTTERLELRPPHPDDLPWVLEQMNTPAVMHFLGGEIRSAQAVTEGFHADMIAFDSGGHQRWTIWRREEPCRVGRCGLFPMRSRAAPEMLRGEWEIGWTLAEPFWSKGYASEAATAVIAFAFSERKLAVIYAQTSDTNLPSTRMMNRLGFTFRPELGYVDPDYPAADNPTTVYSISAGEWLGHG